jgi:uncharacterized iron-regulated membrane protein
MLITFKTKAAPDVIMYKEHAQRILELFHKGTGPGVLTAAETGAAVTRLEAEIAASRAHAQSEELKHDVELHHGANGDDNEHEAAETVSFSTRAYPLLEMLRAAQREGQDVVWGV